MKATDKVIMDIGGKVVFRWYEDRDGGRWVLYADRGSELEFLRGTVIIANPPKGE